ncbi:hypothetical protein PsorP6_009743 [Peronosclerospora sorghi]|uniref:Uncharacterized protein n=1 Tax=Peronosclerospora sorghi TaxID=230839 RepID=A0ACC0W0I8_9STRA|nr:hypothetical protein PsorP6_019467 [Peronosclerospora sorghi]KAI9911493.1 hypothetical protein PsorP6_009743 [Peronosclerospora sorghi]
MDHEIPNWQANVDFTAQLQIWRSGCPNYSAVKVHQDTLTEFSADICHFFCRSPWGVCSLMKVTNWG